MYKQKEVKIKLRKNGMKITQQWIRICTQKYFTIICKGKKIYTPMRHNRKL